MGVRAAILAAAVLLGGCATGGANVAQRHDLARQIADDAAAFNDAYAQAVSAQILLNILRSRDRLPRSYLAMTGISDSPSWRTLQNGSVGGIPLGGGGTPIGIGGIGLERESETRPSYAVQPYDAEMLTRTVFEPTQPHVFAHYWRSGWPRDLLLFMMVDRLTRIEADGHVFVLHNEANEIFENCPARIDTEGCDFVRDMRAFLARVERHSRVSEDASARAVCGLVEAYRPARPVRAAAPREDERCDPTFVVEGDTYVMRLRSLDEMVYYVGELLRVGSMQAGEGGAIEAPLTVNAAGLRGGGAGVPLFRVLPQAGARHRIYGAEVRYGAERYFAAPAIGRSCAAAQPSGPCQDTAEEGDRSSSALSLIAEILALNQSPDAIRAPNRLIAE